MVKALELSLYLYKYQLCFIKLHVHILYLPSQQDFSLIARLPSLLQGFLLYIFN